MSRSPDNRAWLDAEVELEAGQRLTLAPLRGPLQGRSFEAEVAHVVGDTAFVAAPKLGGVRLAAGTPLRIGLRVAGTFFAARSRVAELAAGPVPLLGIHVPEMLEPQDQRAYFRLPTVIAPESAQLGGGAGREDLAAIITNVSGGGVELAATRAAMVGTLLTLDFALGPLTLLERAEVRAAGPRGRGSRTQRLHCRFLEMDRRVRERVVRHVFDAQRDLLQRGLLGARASRGEAEA